MPQLSHAPAQVLPLCVDLDGTLVLTDTLWENALLAVRARPWILLLLPLWLLRGRPYFKQKLASISPVAAEALPYNQEFLSYLRLQAAAGRELLLVTAADESIAKAVVGHLGIFSGYLASDGQMNLKGSQKAAAIHQALGNRPFEYAGNEKADLPVWREADQAIAVNTSPGCLRELQQLGRPTTVFDTYRRPTLKTLAKALRVHQWVKNLLVFAPAFLAHKILDPTHLVPALWGFLAFSLTASAIYVVNDVLDIQSDRLHPRKRFRPFAAGILDLRHAAVLVTMLISSAFVVSLQFPTSARLLLAGYAFASCAYSLYFKRLLFLDVMTLATFYTVRVLFGGIISDITVSVWAQAFFIFLFLSLAMAKRVAELKMTLHLGKEAPAGRCYYVSDLAQLQSFGGSSGYIAVLVLALYIQSPEVRIQYAHPEFLWAICLLLLYWIGRLWILINRGFLPDDPIAFAARDRASIGVFAACVLVIAFAKL